MSKMISLTSLLPPFFCFICSLLYRVLIPSMLSKLNEENNLDTDLKDVTKLLRELRDALSHFRYAVSHDIHMNCPTVETCIVADTTAA